LNVFQAVKDSVTTRQAAESYGFQVRHNGMMCCPFHDDKNPSMKVDNRFHCFGCGEDGDVIDFVGKLYSLSPKQAAEKLAHDFGVSYDGQERYKPVKGKKPSIVKRIKEIQITDAADKCVGILCDYFRLMTEWKKDYAPKSEDEQLHPLFVEALHRLDYIDYVLDELQYATIEQKAEFIAEYGKEVLKLEQRLRELDPRNESKAVIDAKRLSAPQDR